MEVIGQRFGRLTVQGETLMRFHGAIVYVCVCDCGGSCLRAVRDLRFAVARGVVPGCGCTAIEQRRRRAKAASVRAKQAKCPAC